MHKVKFISIVVDAKSRRSIYYPLNYRNRIPDHVSITSINTPLINTTFCKSLSSSSVYFLFSVATTEAYSSLICEQNRPPLLQRPIQMITSKTQTCLTMSWSKFLTNCRSFSLRLTVHWLTATLRTSRSCCCTWTALKWRFLNVDTTKRSTRAVVNHFLPVSGRLWKDPVSS